MTLHQPSVERALITFKVKHLSALTLSRNGLSGLWNNEVMSFLHTAGKSFGFHTGAAAYTKPALLNAFKATLLPCQRVLPKLRVWNVLTQPHLQGLWGGSWCLDRCPVPELGGWDAGAQDVRSRVTCTLLLHLKCRNVEQDLVGGWTKAMKLFPVVPSSACSLNLQL